jgi:asparagine synthase (glutamine-hydrolysing)
MCGIAGWFSVKPPSPDAEAALRRMGASLSHRGPDGQGQFLTSNAGLAHTRLSIIDLKGGAQPMHSADGAISIVFNGEIYNYRELRSLLSGRGQSFRTHSDTEVIIALYRAFGSQGLARLRGMYAIAMWDSTTRSGLLARDLYGIKPLFFRREPDAGLSFGSEAKAILARGGRARLEPQALHLALNFRYLPGDRSMFAAIDQVPPGTVLVWTADGRVDSHRIDAPASTGLPPLDALRESVALHCTADVEVGGYLSGGVDSAIIARFARDAGNPGLRTFTVAFGDDPRETANAARTAELLGVGNFQSDTVPSPADVLPRLIRHLEIPKVNAFQVSCLARHAARHVKVALSGLGGDELFYGYEAHRILHHAAAVHRLSGGTSAWFGRLAVELFRGMKATPWTEPERAMRMAAAGGHWPRVYALLRNVWDSEAMRKMVYGPRMLEADLPDAFDVLESHWPDEQDPVRAMTLYEWRHKMVNDLLWQEDRASMAEGLEVRVPFVDAGFAPGILAMSRDELMPGGKRKAYMRQMVSSMLPREILARPKSGFQVDSPAFVSGALGGLVASWLSEERVRQYGLFNAGFVRRILALGPHQRYRWHYFMIYMMLATHIWIEQFDAEI